MASPCPRCGRVYVPPRSYCEDCFVKTSDEWIEAGPEGAIEAFTVTYASFPGYPEPPYAVAYVRPDGADTAMANFVSGVDCTDADTAVKRLSIGTRMRAVFGPDRKGRITDFSWEPVDQVDGSASG